MTVLGIFDGQLMQAEFFSHRFELGGSGSASATQTKQSGSLTKR